MTHLQDAERYREEAARFLELAQGSTDSRELRDSYLALALQYEQLARILEARASQADDVPVAGDEAAVAV